MQRDFPIGAIHLWTGSIANIPSTWRLCDGTQNTPDLRNKFIVGSGDTYAVNAIGGNINHNHDFTGDGHIHSAVVASGVQSGAGYDPQTEIGLTVGTCDIKDGRPPYFAKAFIMYAGRPR